MFKNIKFVAVGMASACALFAGQSANAQVAQIYSDVNTRSDIYSCAYFGGYIDSSGAVNGNLFKNKRGEAESAIYGGCAGTFNQPGTVTAASAILQTAATQTAGLISDRVSAALAGTSGFNVASNSITASTGLPAGNNHHGIGLWASASYTDSEDDNADTRFDADAYTAFVGVDYKVTPRTVIGLAVGYEDTEIDTQYNASPVTGEEGNVDGDGYTIAPYIGIELSPKATFELSGGYSDLEYDSLRFDPNLGNRITGSTDADRYFVNAALSGKHTFRERWNLRGQLSVFYAEEEKDAFVETVADPAEFDGIERIAQDSVETSFGQAGLDAELGYAFRYVEPYALVGLEYDFEKDDSPVFVGQTESLDEDFGARFGAGLNVRFSDQVTGGFEAYTLEFRDDYEEYGITGGLRVNF